MLARPRAPRCPSCRPSAPSATSATGRLPAETARLFATRPELGDYFEEAATAAGEGLEPPVVASWVKDELVGRLDAEADPAASNVSPQALAKLAGLVQAGTVTRGAGRQVLDRPRRRRAATRRRSSSARASARWATATSSPRSSRA